MHPGLLVYVIGRKQPIIGGLTLNRSEFPSNFHFSTNYIYIYISLFNIQLQYSIGVKLEIQLEDLVIQIRVITLARV